MSASTTSYKSSRRQRPKIEKTNEEFKQHESVLMGKRNTEVNNSVTKVCIHFNYSYPSYESPFIL